MVCSCRTDGDKSSLVAGLSTSDPIVSETGCTISTDLIVLHQREGDKQQGPVDTASTPCHRKGVGKGHPLGGERCGRFWSVHSMRGEH